MLEIFIIIQSVLLIITSLSVIFYIYKIESSKQLNEKIFNQLNAENYKIKSEIISLNEEINDLNFESESIEKIKEIVCILGIWPKVDNLEPIKQAEELESILTAGFDYIKLSGRNVSKALIVNELSLEPKINVTHVGAHGNEDGVILSNDGSSEIISGEWFGKLFYRQNVKVVLLFSCESQKIVDTIYRMQIPCVLGFRRDVNDNEVIEFVKEFYKYLQAYKDVKKAVDYAKLSSAISNEFYDDIILRGNYIFE